MESMTGNSRECLEHFFGQVVAENNKNQNNFFLSYLELSSVDVIQSWANKERSPYGFRLVKIIFLLQTLGYQVTDVKNLPEPALKIIAALGTNSIKPPLAAIKIGYRTVDHLSRVLLGKTNPSKKSLVKMSEVLKQYPIDNGLISIIHQVFLPPPDSHYQAPVAKKPISVLATDNSQQRLLAAFLKIVGNSTQTLEPILEKYISQTDSQIRQELRDFIELEAAPLNLFKISNSVFRLSQLLNALCSEKALEKFKA